MDITYVCIIIEGTIKKILIKFIKGGWPSYRAKTARDRSKIDQMVNFDEKQKIVPPMDITYVCIIIRRTIKKTKIKFVQGGEPSYRAKTMRD